MVSINTSLALLILTLLTHCEAIAQQTNRSNEDFSRAEKLRGSITPEREWWDLEHYDLSIEVDPEAKSIRGTNIVSFNVLNANQKMQIDLQQPLHIDKVLHGEAELEFEREGNVYWINFARPLEKGSKQAIQIEYSGVPIESKNPPWSGGISWKKDSKGQHFIATSCQGIGASIWWPCKDHGYDEPDRGMEIRATVPSDLTAVSNGRLQKVSENKDVGTKTFHWVVRNPINNYCINLNIGDYVNFSESFDGEAGALDMDYWVLKHDRQLAVKQFVEAPRVIEAFEYWFGPYPFYEDSYKLVQVPYLGMEHQSSVTYGNGFRNGYRGMDLSGTGVGLKFDFIIVHETGHEWFGNNISMKDAADMWIHESFTNYSENLFVEYFFTQKEAEDYVIGCRERVANDAPIIGTYGVNRSGSKDMYYKGGNMLHTIRHIIDNDIKWRSILRGLNQQFRHKTVTTDQIEKYVSQKSGIDLSKVFDQYLRTADIPEFHYKIDGRTLTHRFEKVVDGFSMPIKVKVNDQLIKLHPTFEPQTFTAKSKIGFIDVDRNFYVNSKPE